MRKRNSLLLFIVLSLSMPCLSAQNTGYMGKRVIVNMGAHFSPAWKRPINKSIQPKWLAFNYILSPSIEIIVHKRGTAGLVYHYLSTRYNTPLVQDRFGDIIWIDSIYEDLPPVVEKLTAHGFGVFYKQYLTDNSKAPIGPYLRFQFDGFFYQCPTSYEDRAITMDDKLFAIKLEFGNDFLLFDRLHLSTGFLLGIPFGGYKGLGYDNGLLNFKAIDIGEPLSEYAKSRIFGAYWLGFTLSIGVLTF